MLSSITYSFVHGCKTYTLYTYKNSEPYLATLICYDREADRHYNAYLDSDLFINKTVGYIDQHIVEWYEKAEKRTIF